MPDDTYRALQKQLNTYSVGFPAAESGIEIQILKYLSSEKDAEMFLALSPKLEIAAAIADRLKKPVDEIFALLDDMAERDLPFRLGKGEAAQFGTIPFMHGVFEFTVEEMTLMAKKRGLI